MKFAVLIVICVFSTCLGFWDSECQVNSGVKCKNDIEMFEVESNKICPMPIMVSSKISVFWSGTFLSAQNITSLKLKVYYGFLLVKTIKNELEGFYEENEYENFEYHFEVPSYSPIGKYSISGGLINSEGEQINCWKSQIEIKN